MSSSPAISRSANAKAAGLSPIGTSRRAGAATGTPPCRAIKSAMGPAWRLSSVTTRRPSNGADAELMATSSPRETIKCVPRADRAREFGVEDTGLAGRRKGTQRRLVNQLFLEGGQHAFRKGLDEGPRVGADLVQIDVVEPQLEIGP